MSGVPSKTFALKHLEDISSLCNFESENKHSNPVIDEINKVLAQHYGFTEEELDFIINYDIKYHMGGEELTNE